MYYYQAKTSVIRIALALAQELKPHECTAGYSLRARSVRGHVTVALTAAWFRSQQMLDNYGVTEANWRDAPKKQPHFIITETPR